MPIKLSLELVGPIEEGDHVILSGAAMLLFALANNAMTEDTSEEEGAEEEEPAPFPSPCNKPEDGTDRVCVGPVGHRGRHLYRGVPASPVMN